MLVLLLLFSSPVQADDFFEHGFLGLSRGEISDMIGEVRGMAAAAQFSVPSKPVVQKPPSSSPDFTSEWENYASKAVVPLDWKSLLSGPSRVVYLGEPHHVRSVKEELGMNFAAFRQAGITHLALEMIASRHQEKIEDMARDKSPTSVREVLVREWGHAPDSYVAMILSAQAEGLTVFAMDLHREKQVELRAECIQAGHSNGKCIGEIFEARDTSMKKVIRNCLEENPDNRVVALVGSDHIELTSQHKDFQDSRAYVFAWSADYISTLLLKAGYSKRRLFLPMSGSAVSHNGWIFTPKVVEEGMALSKT